MPTYEYKCTKCNYTFEIFQPMSAETLKECPKCKGLIKRLIGTGSGPIFKGSGFYQTDYKNKPGNSAPNKKEGKKEEKKDSKSSDKGSKSTDSSEKK
ncbi:MAG: FmdB family transcriptional regulator [Ignavibacteria bacterium RBG_16_34_14]|nr:MAG: FmdB family transcriptional regulator [Ignavibacteria bacterium RBG_16_34_14]